MIIGVLNERDKNENRVAITPEVTKRFNTMGIKVFIENECFIQADFNEKDFILGAKSFIASFFVRPVVFISRNFWNILRFTPHCSRI